MRKLVLRSFLSPGDILMLTAAVRDLHRAYPNTFLTDVRTSCPQLWENNPYLTPLDEDDPTVEVVDCHYPLINRSNQAPFHFIHGYIHDLNRRLGLAIEPTEFKGDIHLSPDERSSVSPIEEITGRDTPFWIIVAGGKYDYTIKWWDHRRYQDVVDYFRDSIQFVQVGERGHHHPELEGVIDLRGQADHRQLIRLVHHSQGVLTPVSFLMHLAAAVEARQGEPTNRPCVVVAGGREPTHWEAYPHHQFIHTIGALPCCADGGCWKSRTFPIGDGDPKDGPDHLCVDVVGQLPRCMHLITAADVIQRINLYFAGGVLKYRAVADPRAPETTLTTQTARAISETFIRSIPRFPGGFRGRGIVICAGGSKFFTDAWVGIKMLRFLGCTIPVQVWYLGRPELDDRMEAILRPLGVECVDATEVRTRHPARRLNGFELKPYALLHSPFKEVLLLDADNMPVVNPEYLFSTPQYQSTGALFWPDLRCLGPERLIWDICGVPHQHEPEFESGQLVLDKERCWRALVLCMWYNEHSDFYYQHIHGDKDTFHMAFRKTGTAYAMVDFPVEQIQGVLCQRDFSGTRVFQHQRHWSLYGENMDLPGMLHQAEGRDFAAQLRRLWDGRIGGPQRFDYDSKSARERRTADNLTSNMYTYHRVGYDQRSMEFLANGTIGRGAASREVYWNVAETDHAVILDILSWEEELTCRLKQCQNRVWTGRWLNFERMPVELAPARL